MCADSLLHAACSRALCFFAAATNANAVAAFFSLRNVNCPSAFSVCRAYRIWHNDAMAQQHRYKKQEAAARHTGYGEINSGSSSFSAAPAATVVPMTSAGATSGDGPGL